MDSDPLAVLGHEVRNLIATFVGFSELLLSQDWPPEKQREYLETMHDEGLRVSHFLNELLDLQRIEATGIQLNRRPVDLSALLRFAADVAAHDPVHPIVLYQHQELPLALADPDRIQQVLANLLSNARKYSPGGGPIEISSKPAGCYVQVCVADSGVGIPPEALGRVFDKFFRVESMLHRDVRGVGLGLAVSRQIIEAHQGHIWAESAGLGYGTRVCFSLPIAPAQAVTVPLQDACDRGGVVLAVHHNQDLAREHGLLQVRGGIDGDAYADQSPGDRAVAAAGTLDVLPEVTRAEHAAEARDRDRFDLAQPVDELSQTVAMDGHVFEPIRGAGVLLERFGVMR